VAKRNSRTGSSLDDFLKEEGVYDRVHARALKRALAEQIDQTMSKKRFESVWDAIEDTAEDAAAMRARADLMLQLQEHLRKRGVTQGEAAKLLKVAQPRVSDLMRGRIDLFSTDLLIELLGRVGARVTMRVAFRKAA
jgi:predicted XRE-type DNA-binding protein